MSQATELVGLAESVYLFHTPDQQPFAKIDMGGHYEIWPVRQKGFRRYLVGAYFGHHGKAPGSQAVQDALAVLEGKALFAGAQHSVHVRIAEHAGAIYLDLANDRWEGIEITADGWRVVAEPPVFFRRPSGLAPLPLPVSGGSLEAMWEFVNVSPDDWILVKAWLAAALNPRGPYPVLDITGTQGSAKTTTARFLRSLIDPNVAAVRSEPREIRDLMIAATNAMVVSFDNLSRMPVWLSDAVCRLSTGGGFSTRELYSDSDEVLFDTQRPVITNGIEERATRGDLLDRSLLIFPPSISSEQRKPERDLWRAFEAARPRILGALLDAVSMGLRRAHTVQLSRLPRMADFAVWAVAAAPALGFDEDAFLKAYEANRQTADDVALEADQMADIIRSFTLDHPVGWKGTATELLGALNQRVDDDTRRMREWPKTPNAMGNVIRRLAPNLRAEVLVSFDRTGRHRLIVLEQVAIPLSPSSQSSQPGPMSDDDDDGDVSDDGIRTQSNATAIRERLSTLAPMSDNGDVSDDGIRTQSETACGFCQKPSRDLEDLGRLGQACPSCAPRWRAQAEQAREWNAARRSS